tara:strand:- start:99 stop:296 length:198 start_codon:yes stop_codon:yes gene_type:complete
MSIVEQRIASLVQEHGSLRKVALNLGINAGHLSRVRAGKRDPGPKLAEALGLTPVTTYVSKEKQQ